VSNIHLMNNLPCHLAINLRSGNFSDDFSVNATLNQIVYDLQPGRFEMTIKGDESCGLKEKSISFDLESKQVSQSRI
jgi:hypothetical protein